MAQCYFCSRKFDNQQGVRAHLKTCDAYQNRTSKTSPISERLRAGAIGKPAYKATKPKAESFDRGPHRDRRTLDEEVGENISSLAPDEPLPDEQAESADNKKNVLLRSVLEGLKEDQRLLKTKQARIETGKRHAEGILKGVLSLDFWDKHIATREVEQALDRELTGQESPDEAEQIAEGALAPWLEKDERLEEEKREKKRKEDLQIRKGMHVELGVDIAQNMEDEDGMSSWDKSSISQMVRHQLEEQLDGTETKEDLFELVEALLFGGRGEE